MSDAYTRQAAPLIAAIEAEMQAVLAEKQPGIKPFYGMIHYHMGWVDEQFAPLAGNGGKRIRPVLCLLACAAAGGDWQQAVPAGAAIEILHNFTLIHDDIQDASPTRRGRPTVWTIWGSPQAINAGDAMFAAAHLAMARLFDRGVPAAAVVQAIRRLDETCLDLTIGQHLDMDFEGRAAVVVDEYLRMINGKTAALLALCTELGAIIAGQDEKTIRHYQQFGLKLGLAFQVIDDILGIWGEEAVIGKSAATDIETRKKTLPVLFGIAESSALRDLYEAPADSHDGQFVSEAIRLLDEIGAREFAEAKATELTSSALEHFAAASPAGDAGQALEALTANLLRREH
ncbi:MAG: polyprenyl synthetase family protein [Anaerolineales bacterium]|nr:polyprenyl synthetase family protein [Anaerolineales bacterium]MCB0006985.1 polyprenyl synthetase family protein [Anaerolineales bacterium]MCB0012020.1 polyprenyl synthetase family protein [Anaerolineales bacterium]MCB0016732.1 polyprenyl synthetase family protein [Anaerolineales bacterium]MCB8962707.1 polyprenyl synthetase family protein [Ardenticatenales bacterium]